MTATFSLLCWAASAASVFFTAVLVTGGAICSSGRLPQLQSSSCSGPWRGGEQALSTTIIISYQAYRRLALPVCLHPNALDQDSPRELQWPLLQLLTAFFQATLCLSYSVWWSLNSVSLFSHQPQQFDLFQLLPTCLLLLKTDVQLPPPPPPFASLESQSSLHQTHPMLVKL